VTAVVDFIGLAKRTKAAAIAAEQAQQNAEASSKLISQLQDTVQANARWLTTTSPAELLQELDHIKTRAEAAAAASEEANRKANSEAGYAFNAKQYSEEHGKTIAQIKGTVEADFNWLVATKKHAESAADAIVAAKDTVEADARATTAAMTDAESELVVLRTFKDKAEAAQSATEKARDESTALAKRCAEDSAAGKSKY
jgi:hypothetical protein